jgi:hypothetical protein
MGGRFGLEIALGVLDPVDYLFNEGPGRLIVSVSPKNQKAFEGHFAGLPFQFLGTIRVDEVFKIENRDSLLLSCPMGDLIKSWKRWEK